MINKLNLGIEITEAVLSTSAPQKIKRYYNIEKVPLKASKKKAYKCKPGFEFLISGGRNA